MKQKLILFTITCIGFYSFGYTQLKSNSQKQEPVKNKTVVKQTKDNDISQSQSTSDSLKKVSPYLLKQSQFKHKENTALMVP